MSHNETGELIRVAIVDDHKVLVDALMLIIQTNQDMTVVATGGNCRECIELVQRTRPQVLLLDVMLPDGNGIDLVASLKDISPETNVLILTSLNDETTLMRAMQTGASGFASKGRNLAEVLQSIRKTAAGEIAIPTGLLLGLLNRTPRDENAKTRSQDTITQREREILTLLARGKSVDEIAALLTISPLTVRTHIRNLLQKMGVKSRLQAVTCALKSGLIESLV